MILVVGASGGLGGRIARYLLAEGFPVRAMTRNPEKVEELRKLGAEIVEGDLRRPASLHHACHGIEKVVTSATAIIGEGDNNLKTVDRHGNFNLIDAALKQGIRQFVFTSVFGASPNSPVDFSRVKYEVEQYLEISGLTYTILRPNAFMETWATMIGRPIFEKGKATIFGPGTNPVSFVSRDDVAHFVVEVLKNPEACNRIIEIGGPESLTLNQVADMFVEAAGQPAKINHISLPVLRALKLLLRPFNPNTSRLIGAAINLNEIDAVYEMTQTLQLLPVRLTSLKEVIETEFLHPAETPEAVAL